MDFDNKNPDDFNEIMGFLLGFSQMRAEGLEPWTQDLKVHEKIGKNPLKIAVFAGMKTACTVFAPTCKLQHLYAMISNWFRHLPGSVSKKNGKYRVSFGELSQ